MYVCAPQKEAIAAVEAAKDAVRKAEEEAAAEKAAKEAAGEAATDRPSGGRLQRKSAASPGQDPQQQQVSEDADMDDADAPLQQQVQTGRKRGVLPFLPEPCFGGLRLPLAVCTVQL